MSITLADSVASAMADAVTTAVDAGAAAGTLSIYTGAKPATPADAATGTLLATITLADPAAAAAAAGVAAWTGATSVAAAASGTAGWFRVADSNGIAVFDGTVGTAGADLNFDSVAWTAGGTVTLTGGNFTQPTE
jgi:hypothetical protein